MNRDQFFLHLNDRLTTDGLLYVQKAYWLAKEAHRKQIRRLSGERFFEHLRRVTIAAVDFGYTDAEILALCLLHDIIEDTFVPPAVIVSLFGSKMYGWVLNMSKEVPVFNQVTGKMIKRAKIADDEYYPALAVAPDQVIVAKGCDRFDNLKDLAQWEPARKAKYVNETNTRILPLIRDIRIAKAIEARLAEAA